MGFGWNIRIVDYQRYDQQNEDDSHNAKRQEWYLR